MNEANHQPDPTLRAQMIALAHQSAGENFHLADLPYRLSSWALDTPDNVQVWRDADGSLAAWAVMNTPFWTIDSACRPDRQAELTPQILAWADARARDAAAAPAGHPCWFVMVFARQTGRIQALETAGFASQADVGENSWSKVLLERPGDLPIQAYRLPEGFAARPLHGLDEVEAYVALHQAVFESKNMTAGWRARVLRQPSYDPELDLVIAAPDGRLAAFCICWMATLPDGEVIGQVEPLGCHADFRRLALGRLALAEGLRRLQQRGAQRIIVETDSYRNTASRLYEALGFTATESILVFRKDYP